MIWAVVNSKGGVGKSSLSLALAAECTTLTTTIGQRVCRLGVEGTLPGQRRTNSI